MPFGRRTPTIDIRARLTPWLNDTATSSDRDSARLALRMLARQATPVHPLVRERLIDKAKIDDHFRDLLEMDRRAGEDDRAMRHERDAELRDLAAELAERVRTRQDRR